MLRPTLADHARANTIANVMNLDGKRFRLRREAMGLTQDQLCERSGVSQSTIDRVEKGMAGAASKAETRQKLADALGVTVDWLTGRSNESPPEPRVDRHDVEPEPVDVADGIDVEPLVRALAHVYAQGKGRWSSAVVAPFENPHPSH